MDRGFISQKLRGFSPKVQGRTEAWHGWHVFADVALKWRWHSADSVRGRSEPLAQDRAAAALRWGLGHRGGLGHGGGSPECGGAVDPGRVGRRRGARGVRLGLASATRGTMATGVGLRRLRTRRSSSVRRCSSGELIQAHERERDLERVRRVPHLAANLTAASLSAGTQWARRLTAAWSSVAQQWRRRGSARAWEMAVEPPRVRRACSAQG